MKRLLVLGGSSDVGTALIDKVVGQFDQIIAHYGHNDSELLKLQSKYGTDKIILKQCDFTNLEQTELFAQSFIDKDLIPTHIVHLPATPIITNKFNKISWDKWDKDIKISLQSIVIILQKLLPKMSKLEDVCKVVFMLTVPTTTYVGKFVSSYITVKYALLGLMKSLAVEYQDSGICVNAISPDFMDTKFLRNMPDLLIQTLLSGDHRIMKISEVLPTFEYLLSPASDCVTGQNIAVYRGLKERQSNV